MDTVISLEGNFITFFDKVGDNGFSVRGVYPRNICVRKDAILQYTSYDLASYANCWAIDVVTTTDKLTFIYSTYDNCEEMFKKLHNIMIDNNGDNSCMK